jgi:hypothetical protein
MLRSYPTCPWALQELSTDAFQAIMREAGRCTTVQEINAFFAKAMHILVGLKKRSAAAADASDCKWWWQRAMSVARLQLAISQLKAQ